MMLWFLRAPLMLRTFIAGCLFLFLASSAGAAGIYPVRDSAHSSKHAKHTAKAAPHSSRSKARSARTKAAPHRTARSARSTAATRKPVLPGKHLRRARYGRRSRARYVPLATVPIRRSSAQSDFSAGAPAPDAGSPTSAAAAPAGHTVAIAAEGDSSAATASEEAFAVGQIASLNVPRVYGRYALRGTHDSLVRQNERVELESLQRIEDDNDLQNRIASGSLVKVPESAGLMVNPGLPEDRRYCRPWTAEFLSDLSRAYEVQFHKPLIVSSAVRTVEFQKHLMRVNHNAAEAEGDIVSPHLTGATIDIAKSGLSRREMQWMRDHLFAYQTAGVIDVEEEFRQRCFHITVYKNYSPASSPAGPHHDAVPQTVPPDPSTATVSEDTSSRNK